MAISELSGNTVWKTPWSKQNTHQRFWHLTLSIKNRLNGHEIWVFWPQISLVWHQEWSISLKLKLRSSYRGFLQPPKASRFSCFGSRSCLIKIDRNKSSNKFRTKFFYFFQKINSKKSKIMQSTFNFVWIKY